jgi:predicted site-specific integrase-resolvase
LLLNATIYAKIMDVDDDLIGSAEAATILSVDQATISRWVANGTLTPATKLPGLSGAFLFHRTDIEKLQR